MADTKTTALTENTTPAASDIMMIVDDPGGSAATQKITVTNLATLINSLSGRVLISEQTPTGTGTLSWASIPATYKSLEIEYVARGTTAATTANMACYLNNDTTATNYRRTLILGGGTTTISTSGDADAVVAIISAATAPAGSCGSGTIKIVNYASTTFNKQILARNGARVDDSSTFEYQINTTMEWESTTAVNRVDLTLSAGNYDTGSTLRLYGVF